MPQRSPVIFWLLLGATVCVDGVVLYWLREVGYSDRVATLFFGLTFGQLSVACIWTIFSPVWMLIRGSVLSLVIMLIAVFTPMAEPPFSVTESLALYAMNSTALVLTLWAMRTAWQQFELQAVRYSMLQLMGLMTLLAIMIVLLRSATNLRNAWSIISAIIVSNVVIATACTLISSAHWHWVVRLGSALAVGSISGWLLTLIKPNLSGDLEVMNIVHALVILAWIELARITPAASVVATQPGAAADYQQREAIQNE
jgi:hypothetical protein